MGTLLQFRTRLANFARAVANLGFLNALLLKWQQMRARWFVVRTPYRLRSKHSRYPLWCRPGTSDAGVFHQIFVTREYACLDDVVDPVLILDCGANVGYSSAYFLSRFPQARVVAVEPDPGNAEMLALNLRPFGARVTIVRSAVWSHPAGLVLDRAAGDGQEWSRQVRECRPGETPDLLATDIPSLLAAAGQPSLSILKIDVEGAEAAIFASGYEDWLPRVSHMVIELHGAACERIFYQAVSGLPCELSCHEELTVFRRTAPLATQGRLSPQLSHLVVTKPGGSNDEW